MALPRFNVRARGHRHGGRAALPEGRGRSCSRSRGDRAAPAASVRSAAPSTVFVELGEAAQTAQIARDGIGVAQVALNADALQNLIVGRPQLITKVVSQSIAPGTAVPRGTSVDVVLAQPGILPIDVIRDPHLALSGRTLGNVFETFIRDNAAVKNVLARNEQAATLSTADQGMIQAAFQAQQVPITTSPATRSSRRSGPSRRRSPSAPDAVQRLEPVPRRTRRSSRTSARRSGSSAGRRRSQPIPAWPPRRSAQTQSLPAGAIVQRAVYTVTARPAGLVTIGSVAQVRAGAGGDFVVDFQGMRTVERVHAPIAITQIRPWAGTQFANASIVPDNASTDKQFTEVQTERLLVHFSGSLGADDLAANGSVAVLSPPADLELLVNGTRAWFNAGPAKPTGEAGDPSAFVAAVDLTAAVRAAVATAPAGRRERRRGGRAAVERAGATRNQRGARVPADVRGCVPGRRDARGRSSRGRGVRDRAAAAGRGGGLAGARDPGDGVRDAARCRACSRRTARALGRRAAAARRRPRRPRRLAAGGARPARDARGDPVAARRRRRRRGDRRRPARGRRRRRRASRCPAGSSARSRCRPATSTTGPGRRCRSRRSTRSHPASASGRGCSSHAAASAGRSRFRRPPRLRPPCRRTRRCAGSCRTAPSGRSRPPETCRRLQERSASSARRPLRRPSPRSSWTSSSTQRARRSAFRRSRPRPTASSSRCGSSRRSRTPAAPAAFDETGALLLRLVSKTPGSVSFTDVRVAYTEGDE